MGEANHTIAASPYRQMIVGAIEADLLLVGTKLSTECSFEENIYSRNKLLKVVLWRLYVVC